MLKSLVAAGMLLATVSIFAPAQQPRGTASQQTTSSTPSDFVEGNLKFHRSSTGFMQVVDTTTNQNAGTIIFPPGGAPMFVPMPGYDIKTAYEKHMSEAASGAAQTPVENKGKNPNTGGPQVPSPSSGFDAASQTVTLSDGRSVTFLDSENLKVQMPDAAGTQTYDLHYHKTSGGQFAQVWARGEVGHTGMGSGMGGPLSGGVTITAESMNGMPGGKLYDTLEGGNLASTASVGSRIKPIIDVVREAVDIAKPVQPKLADTKVVKTLLNNNLVR